MPFRQFFIDSFYRFQLPLHPTWLHPQIFKFQLILWFIFFVSFSCINPNPSINLWFLANDMKKIYIHFPPFFCKYNIKKWWFIMKKSNRKIVWSVPGAPPSNVTAVATSPTTIFVRWQPPPTERHNGRIIYYKIYYIENDDRPDNLADSVKLNTTEFVIDELRRFSEYKIWVLAGTSVGDGPKSYPLIVQTQEDGKYIEMHSHTHSFWMIKTITLSKH